DPDAGLRELVDQVRDRGLAERDGGKIENDRLAGEKSGRIADPLVQCGQPIGDRRLRGQRKGEERAATKADRMLGLGGYVHGRPAILIKGLTRLARLMVNETLRLRCFLAGRPQRLVFSRLFAPPSCFRPDAMVQSSQWR